jgi:uncharacterized protein
VDGDTPYELMTPTGALFGTLALPSNAAQPPVLLIIGGSGTVDRDGNAQGLQTDVYRFLAHALAQNGIASLRYDKRGVGESGAAGLTESTLRFDHYINDAVAWVVNLKAADRFRKVSIAGHSEGSLIGMLAAARIPVDAFVSLEGAAFPAADVLREQLRPRLAATPSLAASNDRLLDTLAHGCIDTNVPPELMALYRPSVQPYLISWFRYDPRVEIAKLRCAVTIVHGTADTQVSVANAEALAAALPSAKLVIVGGMSHFLKATDQPSATVRGDESFSIDAAVLQAIETTIVADSPLPEWPAGVHPARGPLP